jgi:adenosylcobinamide-GDP ribazoletransferase
MRHLLAAIAFLTRIPVPVPTSSPFSAEDVGRSARWFPVVGALIGVIYLAVYYSLSDLFPPAIVAIAIVVTESFLTGALHLDGLADMADGFGGGHSREEVLRIMRDHAIGSYGAVALILLIALKLTALTGLIERHQVAPYLLISPVFGRWSTVFLNVLLPYARRSEDEGAKPLGSVTDHVSWRELLIATLAAGLIVSMFARWRGLICWVVVVGISGVMAKICQIRIGGVTGDTLGATAELSEVAVLLVPLAMGA